ncbi:MAG: penicillin-binding protein activator [Marinomonas sp.]|nr:MAG: penicillin-binding protein activator [Marinomonas sp.]
MSLFRSRIIPLSFVTLSLIGCGAIETSMPDQGSTKTVAEQPGDLSDYQYAIAQAKAQNSPQTAAPFYFAAAKALYLDEQYLEARSLLESHVISISNSSQFDGLLLLSDIALVLDAPSLALQMLGQASNLSAAQQLENNTELLRRRAHVMELLDSWPNAVKDYMQLGLQLPVDAQLNNQENLWFAIQNLTDNEVTFLQISTNIPLLDGWLSVSNILRNQSMTVDQQVQAFKRWQSAHTSHPAAINPPRDFQIMASLEDHMPSSVAVLLPMSKELKVASEAILDGLLQQYYANAEVQPALHLIDTDRYANFADAYAAASSTGAETIIGPLRKQNVSQLPHLVTDIPTVALNQLEINTLTPNLYHFSLNVKDDIRELIAFARKEGAENSAILTTQPTWAIRQGDQFPVLTSLSYEDTPTGRANAVKQLLQVDESEARIRRIRQWTNQDIESTPRARQDLDYVYYVGKLEDAKQIRPLLNFYFADDIPMLASQTIHDRSPSSTTKNEDIERIVFSELPAILEQQSRGGSSQPLVLQRLTALGNDSYLIAKRLALFTNVRSAKVSAKTGIITLDNNGMFNRRPNIVTYKQGALIDAKESYFTHKETE